MFTPGQILWGKLWTPLSSCVLVKKFYFSSARINLVSDNPPCLICHRKEKHNQCIHVCMCVCVYVCVVHECVCVCMCGMCVCVVSMSVQCLSVCVWCVCVGWVCVWCVCVCARAYLGGISSLIHIWLNNIDIICQHTFLLILSSRRYGIQRQFVKKPLITNSFINTFCPIFSNCFYL